MTATVALGGPRSDRLARVLLAVVALHATDGRATVRGVARRSGRSLSVTHLALCELRRLGAVTWADGTTGTLRPLVGVVR